MFNCFTFQYHNIQFQLFPSIWVSISKNGWTSAVQNVYDNEDWRQHINRTCQKTGCKFEHYEWIVNKRHLLTNSYEKCSKLHAELLDIMKMALPKKQCQAYNMDKLFLSKVACRYEKLFYISYL